MTIAIQLNGKPHAVPAGTRLAELCAELGLVPEHVAVELNRRVVRRDARAATVLAEGDEVEIVTLVGGGLSVTQPGFDDEPLVLGDVRLRSRLLVGTGKYASFEQTAQALAISGTECVTVAVRRVNLDKQGPSLLDHIDRQRYHVLPNTAGCFDAASAIRTAVLAREVLDTPLVKLEVLGDERTLLPDPVGTLEATRELVAQGFHVLVYCSDDPRLAVRLQEAGATSVMPAGSPIGSGQGVLNPNAIRITLELVSVPVIVDAGVGTASDVAIAMELGAAGVLLNTGIASARDPLRMAAAMRDACSAGRQAYLAGRIPRRLYANASSPPEGVVGQPHRDVAAGAQPRA